MCMHLFIGSSTGLPLVPWNPRAPAFHVMPLVREAEAVRRKLHCPLVYYAGGHEGCGCSFNVARAYRGAYIPPDRRLDLGGLMRARRDLDDLGEYLRSHRVAQLYHCWDGTEPEPIASRTRASVEMIVSREFRFRDRQLIEIVPALTPALDESRREAHSPARRLWRPDSAPLPLAAPRPRRLLRRARQRRAHRGVPSQTPR